MLSWANWPTAANPLSSGIVVVRFEAGMAVVVLGDTVADVVLDADLPSVAVAVTVCDGVPVWL